MRSPTTRTCSSNKLVWPISYLIPWTYLIIEWGPPQGQIPELGIIPIISTTTCHIIYPRRPDQVFRYQCSQSNAFWTGYGPPIFRDHQFTLSPTFSISVFMSKGERPDSNQAADNWIVPPSIGGYTGWRVTNMRKAYLPASVIGYHLVGRCQGLVSQGSEGFQERLGLVFRLLPIHVMEQSTICFSGAHTQIQFVSCTIKNEF